MPILPIAAPSCALPDTVAANAHFLAHKVQEVGLCFFETEACLAYTARDLPPKLAELPLRWHVHLPVDLPWSTGQGAAEQALKVMLKASYLNPRFGVLHPPTDPRLTTAKQERLLYDFANNWYKKSNIPLLLENINTVPLANLDQGLFGPKFRPFGVCLDLGHMLGFGQTEIILQSDILKHVGLVHLSAPGKRDEHLALTHLTEAELAIAQKLIERLPQDTCHMIEVFNWSGIVDSYPVLKKLLDNKHG